MRIDIVTLFPEFFSGPLSCGLVQRAQGGGVLEIGLHNPRLMASNRHKTVDDRPYGGGPGMVLLLEPLVKTLLGLGLKPRPGLDLPPELFPPENSASGAGASRGRILFMAPKGRPFDQALARELALEERLTILCGRYEGIDARLEEIFPIEAVSLGDFVLNGGETAALAVLEAVGRLRPGFMGHEESGDEESFSAGLLEYPHYTRPENFAGLEVPEVLRGGDHRAINEWRRGEALRATWKNRPELLAEAALSDSDMALLAAEPKRSLGRNLFCSLIHYPVLDKENKSVASSLTNLDIHDISRSACSYGLSGFYAVTPLQDQLALLQQLLRHWASGPGSHANPDRARALSLVRGVPSLADCVADISARLGRKPFVVGTSAQRAPGGVVSYSEVRRKLETEPVLLVFGTSQGLAPEILAACDAALPPLRWAGGYNHLSVRAAAALTFDRILADWW